MNHQPKQAVGAAEVAKKRTAAKNYGNLIAPGLAGNIGQNRVTASEGLGLSGGLIANQAIQEGAEDLAGPVTCEISRILAKIHKEIEGSHEEFTYLRSRIEAVTRPDENPGTEQTPEDIAMSEMGMQLNSALQGLRALRYRIALTREAVVL
jgi:hypothetical protein